MIVLILATLVWIGCHVGIAGSKLRNVLVQPLGDWGFRGAFSIVSVVAITFLVIAYRQAPIVPLWAAPEGLNWVLVAVMLIAFVLFAASVMEPNPTAVGGEAALSQVPRGITRITRHPMLWSFALWAVVHVLANGDAASLLFFGAFLVTALAGMPSIDAKVAARDPQAWHRFAASTSIVPFAAIATGRNRFPLDEVNWPAVVIGVALWTVLLWAHPLLFGVYALHAGA